MSKTENENNNSGKKFVLSFLKNLLIVPSKILGWASNICKYIKNNTSFNNIGKSIVKLITATAYNILLSPFSTIIFMFGYGSKFTETTNDFFENKAKIIHMGRLNKLIKPLYSLFSGTLGLMTGGVISVHDIIEYEFRILGNFCKNIFGLANDRKDTAFASNDEYKNLKEYIGHHEGYESKVIQTRIFDHFWEFKLKDSVDSFLRDR